MMRRLVIAIRRFLQKEESGATAIEYVVMSAILAAGLVVGAGLYKNSVKAMFGHVATDVHNCADGSC
ncbi:Flp family type IVb pilin [Alsobacter sp. KACC 23698]|uniref:Flp family type IVb pilin n=1 Tax=Alsobacter sp. KACC 23698 TaxID=3149229 RepID=A0AAU7J9V7_9HYPH